MSKGEGRSAARLAAVQALYQMDLTGKGLLDILAEFEAHWIGQEVEGDQYKPAEVAFFQNILQGVLKHQIAIDRHINDTLANGWPLKRIESVLRALLRAGDYELRARADVPSRVIMAEYVDIASAFYDLEEVGMANAVLDKLARDLRPEEFEGKSAPKSERRA